MALSPDDRMLGEKTHYYCSSSEDDDDEVEDEGKYGEEKGQEAAAAPELAPPEIEDYKGYSTNTGPKGVINDWRRFKQLETEKKAEQEIERLELIKKLSLTCRTEDEDERIKLKDAEFMSAIEAELDEFEDEFMKEYRNKRLQEMRQMFSNVPRFEQVISLGKDGFLDAIDKEQPSVTVIIHVFEEGIDACNAMNGCLKCLAREYPTVKFCKIRASDARLSYKFAATATPALLIYKNGELIGNFIRLADEFGNDFFATDVECFLHEHGHLPEQGLAAAIIRNPNVTAGNQESDDSDFDVD